MKRIAIFALLVGLLVAMHVNAQPMIRVPNPVLIPDPNGAGRGEIYAKVVESRPVLVIEMSGLTPGRVLGVRRNKVLDAGLLVGGTVPLSSAYPTDFSEEQTSEVLGVYWGPASINRVVVAGVVVGSTSLPFVLPGSVCIKKDDHKVVLDVPVAGYGYGRQPPAGFMLQIGGRKLDALTKQSSVSGTILARAVIADDDYEDIVGEQDVRAEVYDFPANWWTTSVEMWMPAASLDCP